MQIYTYHLLTPAKLQTKVFWASDASPKAKETVVFLGMDITALEDYNSQFLLLNLGPIEYGFKFDSLVSSRLG